MYLLLLLLLLKRNTRDLELCTVRLCVTRLVHLFFYSRFRGLSVFVFIFYFFARRLGHTFQLILCTLPTLCTLLNVVLILRHCQSVIFNFIAMIV